MSKMASHDSELLHPRSMRYIWRTDNVYVFRNKNKKTLVDEVYFPRSMIIRKFAKLKFRSQFF